MRFVAAARDDNVRIHPRGGAEEQGEIGRKRKRGGMRKRGKRAPDTRLIISIFHSDAPDEKERRAYIPAYPAATINGRFYFADPAHADRSAFHSFFLSPFFPPFPATATTVWIPT